MRRRRTGIVLSVIYGALFTITAVLQSAVATRTGMQGAAPWLGVTSALAAIAAWVSAAKFRASIEQARALSSPVIESFGNPFPRHQNRPSPPDGTSPPLRKGPSGPPPHGGRKRRRRF